ncbi:hypothetical protein AB0E63_42800 [Kribbella sp. NPDC026596]|uniref:hypothetical protein n=1 Tax=Kribbella sp. NPDC026596 TaxID=3155122 RepID=UPI0033F0DFEF
MLKIQQSLNPAAEQPDTSRIRTIDQPAAQQVPDDPRAHRPRFSPLPHCGLGDRSMTAGQIQFLASTDVLNEFLLYRL